jgi:hypothetical protein
MASGIDVIGVIENDAALRGISDCAQCYGALSTRMYGSAQTDAGAGTIIATPADIPAALSIPNTQSQVTLWHFQMGNPVHHFSVIPWFDLNTPGARRYCVLMSYSAAGGVNYTLGDYINGAAPAPTAAPGLYRNDRNTDDFTAMLTALVGAGATLNAYQANWTAYFGLGAPAAVTSIRYWKYPVISAETALANM